MSDETGLPWGCPKDGAEMAQKGRRTGAWRCPECGGLFIDTEAMRRGRRPPTWPRILKNVLIGLLVVNVVRRLRQHRSQKARA